jgi:hypothetical protein
MNEKTFNALDLLLVLSNSPKNSGNLYNTFKNINIIEVEKFLDDKFSYHEEIDWDLVLHFFTLSESFMERHLHLLEIPLFYKTQFFSEEFIKKYNNILNFNFLSYLSPLNENLCNLYHKFLNFKDICIYQKLSEEFIEKYADKIDWPEISKHQKLNKSFIEKHIDKIDWSLISKYQRLSEEFIEKHINKVDLNIISKYQRLSSEFIEKHKLKIPESSWMYKDKEYKRKKILETGFYEVIDDHVIAYKAVRKDYYSIFNFQYLYEIGKEYEAHADYNSDEDVSFGLSAWTLSEALRYFRRGKLLKIKIHLDDIACLVSSNVFSNDYNEINKLRCAKIKIIHEVK